MRLDEAVGERLCEAQAVAVQRIFWIWRMAADGMIDESLLPDRDQALLDYRQACRSG